LKTTAQPRKNNALQPNQGRATPLVSPASKRFLGLKFKRQKPIRPFIAGFVCMEYKLVIEADGGQHGTPEDNWRDTWFDSRGFTILRFWNNEILEQTEGVLEQIRLTIAALSPNPSPFPGRGENI
jgi:very-short-patch-repair endonuclease